MSAEGKWIIFVEATPKPKTKVWHVLAKEGGVRLGVIAWFSRWRGYAFFPNMELNVLVFEQVCLRDIAAFIDSQNAQHRRNLGLKSRSRGADGSTTPPNPA